MFSRQFEGPFPNCRFALGTAGPAKEDAIAAIAECTDTLNRCIEQAHGLGLVTRVIVEAYCDLRVEVKEDEDS